MCSAFPNGCTRITHSTTKGLSSASLSYKRRQLLTAPSPVRIQCFNSKSTHVLDSILIINSMSVRNVIDATAPWIILSPFNVPTAVPLFAKDVSLNGTISHGTMLLADASLGRAQNVQANATAASATKIAQRMASTSHRATLQKPCPCGFFALTTITETGVELQISL